MNLGIRKTSEELAYLDASKSSYSMADVEQKPRAFAMKLQQTV